MSTYSISAEYLVSTFSDFFHTKENKIPEVIAERAESLRSQLKTQEKDKVIRAFLEHNKQTMTSACNYFSKLTCALRPFTNIAVH